MRADLYLALFMAVCALFVTVWASLHGFDNGRIGIVCFLSVNAFLRFCTWWRRNRYHQPI